MRLIRRFKVPPTLVLGVAVGLAVALILTNYGNGPAVVMEMVPAARDGGRRLMAAMAPLIADLAKMSENLAARKNVVEVSCILGSSLPKVRTFFEHEQEEMALWTAVEDNGSSTHDRNGTWGLRLTWVYIASTIVTARFSMYWRMHYYVCNVFYRHCPQ